MMMKKGFEVVCMNKLARAFLVIGFLISATSGFAQEMNSRAQKEIIGYAQSMAQHCIPRTWTSPACYTVVTNSNKVMTANFMATLQQNGHVEQEEILKQGCAAAAALNSIRGLKQEAAASATTQCMNTFSDVASEVDIVPNPTHFQLLMAATYCYRDDLPGACDSVEKSLSVYKK